VVDDAADGSVKGVLAARLAAGATAQVDRDGRVAKLLTRDGTRNDRS
jgi:hypothetical protein